MVSDDAKSLHQEVQRSFMVKSPEVTRKWSNMFPHNKNYIQQMYTEHYMKLGKTEMTSPSLEWHKDVILSQYIA